MASKRKKLLISKKAKKMMHKFVAFPLTSASQILQLQFRIFFNFISFTMPRGEHISLSDKGGIVALRREGKSYRAMQSRERATSIAGLKRIALKVWKNITPAYLRSLYESMPRRMKAVVDANGATPSIEMNFVCILPP